MSLAFPTLKKKKKFKCTQARYNGYWHYKSIDPGKTSG